MIRILILLLSLSFHTSSLKAENEQHSYKPELLNRYNDAVEENINRIEGFLEGLPPQRFKKFTEGLASFYDFARNGETPLLQSFMNTALYLDDTLYESGTMMKTDNEYLGKQSFTYDMAIVTLVYILMGRYDLVVPVLDDYSDNFPVYKNGVYGLYNSYKTDQYDFFFKTVRGRRNLLVIGIDGSRIHTGPNLWVALACQHFYMETGSTRYIELMCDIFNWCYEMAHFKMEDGQRGGISMGYGWGPPWDKIYATEHNVDHYAFVENIIIMMSFDDPKLHQILKNHDITMKKLIEERDGVGRWLQMVYNQKRQTFNRGYNDFGMDYAEALDLTSWGIAAVKPKRLYELKIDPEKMIESAEKKFVSRIEIEGNHFQGFDFTDHGGYKEKRKKPVIWFEGTGQMIVTYHVMADYFEEIKDSVKAKKYRDKAIFQMNEVRRFAEVFQLPNLSLPYCSLRLKSTEIAYAFSDWWPIARGKDGNWVPSLISSSWRYLAELRFNSLDILSRRKQPRDLKFNLPLLDIEEEEDLLLQ